MSKIKRGIAAIAAAVAVVTLSACTGPIPEQQQITLQKDLLEVSLDDYAESRRRALEAGS